ncbi:MAG TPA: MmcQ/YjbR family DNA-binding protein [Steroidobacteraceae bacterium]|nr:MmcQ/YjbR family DNA-binding protein [Steroidobacteraceae bacterium]
MGIRAKSDFDDALARLRLVCLDLPEVVEEKAWVGIRWCVNKKNFAHVLAIENGWPPAYAKAAATNGPAIVCTFRLSRQHCAAARFTRAPYFRPVWFPNIAGAVLDSDTDWDELDELMRDSYRVLAPKKLVARMLG